MATGLELGILLGNSPQQFSWINRTRMVVVGGVAAVGLSIESRQKGKEHFADGSSVGG